MKLARTSTVAAVIFLTLIAGSGRAEDVAGQPPPGAFVDVYIYACQPVEYDFAGVRQDLNDSATWVHDNLFLRTYDGSCRDFYFAEVVPRLEPGLRPRLMPATSSASKL